MGNFDGASYQSRFDALAEQGMDVHGEASLVHFFWPTSVLDAGCGTGRVAIELVRRGVEVIGVDVDASMIGEARRLAPGQQWIQADLATLDLGRQFDVVVMAGNVPLFCPVRQRPAMVGACANHVSAGGLLIAGFQLGSGYDLDEYDAACEAASLIYAWRWATWDRQEFMAGSGYAVSVHRRSQE